MRLSCAATVRNAWVLLRTDPWVLIASWLLVVLVGGATLGLLSLPLEAGVYVMILRRVREGRKPQVSDAFGLLAPFGRWLQAWLLIVAATVALLVVVGVPVIAAGVDLAAVALVAGPTIVLTMLTAGRHTAFPPILPFSNVLVYGAAALLGGFFACLVGTVYLADHDETTWLPSSLPPGGWRPDERGTAVQAEQWRHWTQQQGQWTEQQRLWAEQWRQYDAWLRQQGGGAAAGHPAAHSRRAWLARAAERPGPPAAVRQSSSARGRRRRSTNTTTIATTTTTAATTTISRVLPDPPPAAAVLGLRFRYEPMKPSVLKAGPLPLNICCQPVHLAVL